LAWCWVVVIVLFFSLSASKRSPYILPLAPAVAILVAGVAERWLEGRLEGWRALVARLLHGALGVGIVAAAVILVAGAPWLDPPSPTLERALQWMVLYFALGGFVILAGLAASRRFRMAAPATLLAAIVTIYLAASATALPAADAFKSHRPLCEEILSHVPSDKPLRGFHEWRWRASYSYYTGRPVPNIESFEDLERYWGRDERVFLIVERGRLDEARRVLGPLEPLVARGVGSNFAYLFSSRPAYAE
jgi:4-amino-4-deoxy-L-arabinose transferase-like glycosyltransferase